MLNTPFAPWPDYSEAEAEAVARVIRSGRVNYWTGTEGREFEREFAAWTGTQHAIAVSNGTLALDLALKGLGIAAGDEVIVTPRSFIASVSCVVNAGATPVFADVDRDSGNLSAVTIAAQITDRTRAVIPVHLAGWPCDMAEIMALADTHGFYVIEDCAQAHGAKIGGAPVGSLGHVGAWSFCQDKIMTTGGEGGMVTVNDPALWSRMWSFKDHGKSWDAVYNREHPKGFRWLHESIGTNWRMLEVQAAIGRLQLGKMAKWTERRTAHAHRIAEVLARFPNAVRLPVPCTANTHAYYRQYGYVVASGLKSGWSRDRIVDECTARGAPIFQGSCSEIYLEKAFDRTPWRPARRLPVAQDLGETSLMFLVHPNLSEADINQVTRILNDVLLEATSA